MTDFDKTKQCPEMDKDKLEHSCLSIVRNLLNHNFVPRGIFIGNRSSTESSFLDFIVRLAQDESALQEIHEKRIQYILKLIAGKYSIVRLTISTHDSFLTDFYISLNRFLSENNINYHFIEHNWQNSDYDQFKRMITVFREEIHNKDLLLVIDEDMENIKKHAVNGNLNAYAITLLNLTRAFSSNGHSALIYSLRNFNFLQQDDAAKIISKILDHEFVAIQFH